MEEGSNHLHHPPLGGGGGADNLEGEREKVARPSSSSSSEEKAPKAAAAEPKSASAAFGIPDRPVAMVGENSLPSQVHPAGMAELLQSLVQDFRGGKITRERFFQRLSQHVSRDQALQIMRAVDASTPPPPRPEPQAATPTLPRSIRRRPSHPRSPRQQGSESPLPSYKELLESLALIPSGGGGGPAPQARTRAGRVSPGRGAAHGRTPGKKARKGDKKVTSSLALSLSLSLSFHQTSSGCERLSTLSDFPLGVGAR